MFDLDFFLTCTFVQTLSFQSAVPLNWGNWKYFSTEKVLSKSGLKNFSNLEGLKKNKTGL